MLNNNLFNALFGKTASTNAYKEYVSTATSSSCTSDLASAHGIGSSVPYSSMYIPPNIVQLDDVYIGGMSIQAVLSRLIDNWTEERNVAPDTNLKLVRTFSAEELAKFIVHTSRHIVSGSGDSVAELTAWLNSNIE